MLTNDSKKNKIALMSFHNGYNYGAALQAYALQAAVEHMGFDCEYINYVNVHRKELYDMRARFVNAIKNKNAKSAIVAICGAPFMRLRGSKFKHFYLTNLKQTTEVYKNSREAACLNDRYDKFIIGSDQVWNLGNNGKDCAYLLDFVENKQKKIAYSSSFGMSHIPEEFQAAYSKNLSSFSRIAVRETKGVELVKELTGRDAHLVLDPVFLLPKEQWDEFTDTYKGDSYIFVYTDTKSELQDFKDRCKESEKYKFHILSSTLSVSDFANPNMKIRISMSPEDFLSEIKNADFIVTDSFHCLAFALIFHKKFCLILSGNRGKDERLLNLIDITGLHEFVFNADISNIEMYRDIDYDLVDSKLKNFVDYSIKYLNHALNDLPDVEFLENPATKESKYMCEDDRCTGCTACESICASDAIKMKPNKQGFLIPQRDTEKCIDCGMCHKVCQVFYPHKKDNNTQEYWAVKNQDGIRKKSTSGGIFTAISDHVLSHDGVVVAAEFSKDTFTLRHQIAVSKTDRDDMRGTYYVQSDLRGTYKQVKELLKQKKEVLFVGTPCQVYGLKCYLNKIPENLFTCDIVCHGVPSPGVFEKHIEYLKTKGLVTGFRFRDKDLGWRGYTDTAVIDGKLIKNKLWLQSFDNMFSHNIINRLSCSDCQFTNLDRVGDITIGDFWGIEKSSIPEFEDNLGVSLVLCNSEKGINLFGTLEGLDKVKISKSQCLQHSLSEPTVASRSRNQAFHTLEEQGYEAMIKKFGECNKKGFIKNIVRKII